MKYLPICASIILAVAGFLTPAGANETFPVLEPDAVRSAYEDARTDWLPLPNKVRDAFLVAEDRDFRNRPAGRSLITSSITNWYPQPGMDRSFAVSMAIARALNREEILDWFIHGVYLGQGCFGVDGAAMAYFGKSSPELELHEAALLAAIIQAPARLNPSLLPDRSLKRRNHVLKSMAKHGFISAEEASAAVAKPLSVRVPLGKCE
ncbi:transglycosylase domain-containing protein [Paracoccus lutimaris]|uniref:Transglycosylase n=1 Tax=Paracoccus lutimaris TaxID=1490030 RepID=A0A368Z3S8_9RHOB|nr:transglycosylase domain-containing protein [Paracoccus lutimaris]RCW85104.1 transglycosylase [Paracoccus lutimaris]